MQALTSMLQSIKLQSVKERACMMIYTMNLYYGFYRRYFGSGFLACP